MGRLGAIGCFTGCGWNAPGEDVTSSIASLRFNPIAANAAVGTISDYDLPQAAINHMPRLAVTRDPVAQPASGQQCISSPRPGFCVDGDLAGTYTKPITAGMPIGIQPSANRNMLGLSQGGPMPATALKKHGAVRRDTGGTNDIVLYSTPVKEPSPLATRMRADVPTNVTRLATMSNPSVPGTADTIDGGGNYPTPSRPLCITNCGGARGPVTKKTILNFLTGMAGHHVIIGQYENPPGTLKYSNAFTSLTGKHVAILGDGYWPGFPNNSRANPRPVNVNFIAQWKAGGLVYLNEFFPSPTGEDMYGTADPVQVTTPGRAQYIALHAMYDQEAAGLQALQNAGVIVIYRPFMESRFHFWWGFGSKSGWTDALWITLWQQHYNYLTQTKKLDNLIWVYSQGFNAGDGNGHNNYPGDAFVDIQGEDVYSDMASADFGDLYANQTTQHPTKPWAMAEWGSGTPFKSTLNFDMNSLITDIQNNMPKTIFFQAWSGMGPPTKRAGWAIAYMQNVKGAIANPYSLVRENLNRPTTGSGIAIPIPASEFASSGP